MELRNLLREEVGISPGGECHHFEALRQLADDVERLAANGTGGTEDGDAARIAHLPIVRLRTRAGQRTRPG